jgi:hypothetical protein
MLGPRIYAHVPSDAPRKVGHLAIMAAASPIHQHASLTAAYARRTGRGAALGLAASALVLLLTIGWRFLVG